MRALFLAIIAAVLLVILPNGVWLAGSTAVVRNGAAEPLGLAIVMENAGQSSTNLGTLDPGEARFLWVEAVGEATLFLEVLDGGEPARHCGEYVEGAMYHVMVTVHTRGDVTSRTTLPFLNRLLLLDFLRAQL